MREQVPLAPLTTFKIGGAARYFIEVRTLEELKAAALLRGGLPFAVLGGGSNLLVPDEGVDGLVIKNSIGGIERAGDLLIAGAGVPWNEVVDLAAAHGLWGIENLAGIPGTVGGAVVQNIGAYGAELSSVFAYADAFDLATQAMVRIDRAAAAFTYRDSLFKKQRTLIIMRIALRLARSGKPNLSYAGLEERWRRDASRLADQVCAGPEGARSTVPARLAGMVRHIRSEKFPDLAKEGTAGSFFKNPIIAREHVASLARAYPDLPQFPQADGRIKVSLAWVLDHALGLKGLSVGKVRLFERQPLVIVAERGSHPRDVDQLAQNVEEKVFAATKIKIEREVENFSARAM